jgi:hypothetical protein
VVPNLSFRCPLVNAPQLNPELNSFTESESYITTDSQSASRLRPDIYYCQTVAGLLMWGRSLRREDGSVIYNCCWLSPAQSFSGPSPVGIVTIFYYRIFEAFLFVASYDSQGYGGSIRSRLSLYGLGSDLTENMSHVNACSFARYRALGMARTT